MSAKVTRCHRCGRRKRSGEWNAVFDSGILVGYLCPDCQTPEENAEAVIREATGQTGEAVTLTADDPRYREAAAQHILSVADKVWRDWLGEIAASASGETVAVDPRTLPYELADRTMARSPMRPTGDRLRETLAGTFREWLDELTTDRPPTEEHRP